MHGSRKTIHLKKYLLYSISCQICPREELKYQTLSHIDFYKFKMSWKKSQNQVQLFAQKRKKKSIIFQKLVTQIPEILKIIATSKIRNYLTYMQVVSLLSTLKIVSQEIYGVNDLFYLCN